MASLSVALWPPWPWPERGRAACLPWLMGGICLKPSAEASASWPSCCTLATKLSCAVTADAASEAANMERASDHMSSAGFSSDQSWWW
jgi:hypothetical protein